MDDRALVVNNIRKTVLVNKIFKTCSKSVTGSACDFASVGSCNLLDSAVACIGLKRVSRESTADISALHHGADTCGHAADELLLTADAAC